GMDGSRVKMMVDGVQQPVPYNPGATEQRKYPNAIEIDTLQAIEVNKGASSTLYGSDALGGVVLLRTKNPEDVLVTEGNEQRFGIKSGYTSANEQFKTTFTWAMRQDKLETLLMATYANGSE
ncbi:TonB-dependent hemoglobin/transferrin/lactoferrin family receptor, partial [Vibrio anguillarum]|uniref:TonB-dependent receptor plug domain-containing protein n=1 Tax=Vibrio anguillarum TaxID=55601 RepID=UPI00188A00E9